MQSRISSSRMRRNFRLAAILCLIAMTLALGVAGLAESGPYGTGDAKPSTSLASLPNLPSAQAERSSDSLWEKLAPAKNGELERMTKAQASLTLRLNREALKRLLDKAPLEFTDEARTSQVVMTVPIPDGRFDRFRIEESPIMAPELAAKFPEIKTYRGQGIDDPAATIRFDVTPKGFHAQVLSASEPSYIDPDTQSGDDRQYLSYLKSNHSNDSSFECLAGAGEKDGGVSVTAGQMTVPLVSFSNGATLRTYRLALAATGEYTIAAGGTVAAAMARMTTTLNRINGIYERELSLRMTLVANNDLLIYTDPATDPYTNSTPGDMMGQNQTTLDNVIGNPNYDQGHVFGTGPGGTAPVRSTCKAAFKGQGVTGLPNPTGDPFDVDFAAHEMGHQHGGLHTFNTTTGSCSGFRNMVSAFEPGSGSTPMSYVGTCAPNNLQKNANDYFHVRSLEEIVNYMNGDGACAAQTATGNTPPTVNAGASFTIPRNTPFALAASGSDANGDALTYCWEEYDLPPQNASGAAPPEGDADGVPRPILRSYQPASSPIRTFPSLQYILANANVPPATYNCGMPNPCLTGESLPNITRTMNFQATVRDNRAGGGGIASAQMQVNVSAAAGPFVVTQPNTAVAWTGGTPQTVLWNVAGTTAVPVSTASVNILLSTDGGTTFPTLLATGTANDGTESIVIPNVSTTTARIKVEAAGNIYFDISDTNFTITPAAAPAIALSATSYPVTEGTAGVDVTVNRSGDVSGVSTIDFATSDSFGPNNCNVINGSASSRCDYLASIGKLTFSAGQTSKVITIPIVNDSYAEGSEAFTLTLSNPSGATLGAPASAAINIADNETSNGANPIDLTSFFVRQHYLDFLQREPDAAGFAFWSGEIDNCAPMPQCTEVKRINVSASFMLSIEFQNTGYLVVRMYKAAFGNGTGTSTLGGAHQISVPIVRFNEFLSDTQTIGRGVVVNQAGWEQVLEANKQAFATEFVQRTRFTTDFPPAMTAAEFVDKLNTNAGNPLSTAERNQLVSDLSGGAKTRAQVLRAVAEDPDLNAAEFNRAFVLMQYFGYLRRNPNDAPDSDYTGYDFWLTKLTQFNGNFVNAEMIKAFIQSLEYRRRFGP
jgi:reprolysin-like metallo-peptidase family M12B/Calx-beta domain-containing protein